MEINNKMTIPDWLSLEKTELSNSKYIQTYLNPDSTINLIQIKPY